MARITIEDCLSQGVMNQFELVLLAAKRARRLANGADALVDWQNDKPTVVALREIADGKVNRRSAARGGSGAGARDAARREPARPAAGLPGAAVRPRRLSGDS